MERAACRKIYYREQSQYISLAWTWALKLARKSEQSKDFNLYKLKAHIRDTLDARGLVQRRGSSSTLSSMIADDPVHPAVLLDYPGDQPAILDYPGEPLDDPDRVLEEPTVCDGVVSVPSGDCHDLSILPICDFAILRL